MKIAIIGGGPSGIISLHSLLKEGFTEITLFERRDDIGGCWQCLPPETVNFEQISQGIIPLDPVPDELPAKVSPSSVQRFLDTATYSYLETNVHETAMQFDIPFPRETISKRGKDSPFRHYTEINKYLKDIAALDHWEKLDKINNKWRLVLRQFGDTADYIYEKVIVASGHFDVPFVPQIPGLQEFLDFNDTVFRTREQFADKTAIVVGASISAMDGVRDILPVAKKTISSRKPTSEPHYLFGTAAFEHPKVDSRGQITKIVDHTVYFEDGTHVEADAILLGTGFLYHYPFLESVPELLELIFAADDESLAFVGHNQPGLTFKMFQWQAVVVARVFAGKGKLPSKVRNNTTICPDFEEYYNLLREASGDVLPPWDQQWLDALYRGLELRKQEWIENP
ncbi:Flavin-containing monooxygenase FMO GS-OX3 [Candida viswanathii]|uniref:Flavin-containing monooxygenase FMO GS-OX3 n=1 Tax=Candida viswanathii TaxID=5486 RepID=A0A367YKK5_9ASCO|nr:Flavin-containing monooxygenase FMO GS-OX3 [Candida viswanathii]